ncbi:hypothetical protein RB195_014814 [Necator americanus]|uniref:Uncharacterized protein n=1 Tax=Necator americanus TaxID=51031 RepID=A0ABR1E1Q0_NECAM
MQHNSGTSVLAEFFGSIFAILTGQRGETEWCNLRSLLRQGESENEVIKRAWPWPRLEKKVTFGLLSQMLQGSEPVVLGSARTPYSPNLASSEGVRATIFNLDPTESAVPPLRCKALGCHAAVRHRPAS